MGVEAVQPEVERMIPRWALVDTLVSHMVKEPDHVQDFIPMPNPDDDSDENKARYEQYVKRALFTNYIKRTLEGLVGTVFDEEPLVKLTPPLSYLEANIDGSGLSMVQQAREVVSGILTKGRYGILATFPSVDDIADEEGFVSKADMVKNNLQAYAVTYHPKNIIRTREERIGAVTKLVLVVLRETYQDTDDEFSDDVKVQYRVLKLAPVEDEGKAVYHQVIYRDGNPVGERIVPKRGSGEPFDYIPFICVGSEDNSPDVDTIPLYDLAEVNAAHLRNSADFEEACFIVGQPQVYSTGMTEHWIENVWKGRMYFGSRAVLTGPVGSTFGIMQVSPNTMPAEGMKMKEDMMIKLGAQVVMPNNAKKTATEATIENKSDNSILSSIAGNVNDAYSKVLEWLADFNRTSVGNSEFVLNREYGVADASPTLIQAWLTALMQNAMSLQTFLTLMKEGGQLPDGITVEQEMSKLQNRKDGVDEDGDVDILEDEDDSGTDEEAEETDESGL